MRIVIDRDLCIGSAECVQAAPELFDQDEADGQARLRIGPAEAFDLDRARTAVYFCPSGALALED